MAYFLRMKNENPKLKQFQIANQPSYSSSILQRYINDINMLSPNRINPNNTNKRTRKTSNTNFDNDSHPDSDVERPRLTSNDLKTSQTTKSNKRNKNILKRGSIHENI